MLSPGVAANKLRAYLVMFKSLISRSIRKHTLCVVNCVQLASCKLANYKMSDETINRDIL